MYRAFLLGLLLLLSEAALAILKRAKPGDAQSADRGTLPLLWLVTGVSIAIAYLLPANAPMLQVEHAAVVIAVGTAVFVLGLLLRWYSILYLGRFFTVNVAIASDHQVIDSGPYRYIRHPSYTGALMAFAGLGLCLSNWGSLTLILIPTSMAFSWRIRIEEAALIRALGNQYRDYMRHTKRVIPGLY